MKRKSASQTGFYNLRILIGLLTFLSGVSLTLFTMATPSNPTADGRSNVGASTFARVAADGITIKNLAASERGPGAQAIPEWQASEPLGNTLWQVDDENAIADGVAIDANDVWGAWTLEGARLSAYPIGGNGTPDFEFSSFGSGSSGVASAKGADRMAYMESNAAGTISESTVSHPPVTAYRTGLFRFLSAIRICRRVPGSSPSRMTAPRLQLLLAIQSHRIQRSMSLRLTQGRLDPAGRMLFG